MGAAETPEILSQIGSVIDALVRLPLATVLATMLAFRPRRRGTPSRQTAVIQTQIILAIVGAVVMFVVGTSLARAFGIVGAAGLIRYRAKIEDPKDAGVMLSTLALGLACGVGLWALAIFSAIFILGVLVAIESLEPEPYSKFDLTITAKQHATELKPSVEQLFRRIRIPFELRSTSEDDLGFEVQVPDRKSTEAITTAVTDLDHDKPIEVKWDKKKDK